MSEGTDATSAGARDKLLLDQAHRTVDARRRFRPRLPANAGAGRQSPEPRCRVRPIDPNPGDFGLDWRFS
jgi:hypothetical protein